MPLYTTTVIGVLGNIFVNVILWVAFAAVNLNQTSSSAPVAEHEGTGTLVDAVALVTEPNVVTPQSKFEFTVKFIAPVHSSLTGGGGGVPTQISKEVAASVIKGDTVKILT